jgi:hypothetical protein
LTGAVFSNLAIALVRKVAGCGDTLGLFDHVHGLPPKSAEELLPSTPLQLQKTSPENAHEARFGVWGGGLHMVSDFQLAVLITFATVPLVVVYVMLPVRL